MKSTFILLFLLFIQLKSQTINISLTKETDPSPIKAIGQLGTFALVTDTKNLSDLIDPSELESLSSFTGNFTNETLEKESLYYSWNCSLFDPQNQNVTIKCTVNDIFNVSSVIHLFMLNASIEIGNYTINIFPQKDYLFTIETKPFNYPFIYSDPQIIDLETGDSTYELKFKVDSYQNETLTLTAKVNNSKPFSFNEFDEINLGENNELLICKISKEKIEEMTTDDKVLYLIMINKEYGIFNFEFAGEINVNYNETKEDIYVELKEALNDKSEFGSLIAFETNISEISPLTSNEFDYLLDLNNNTIKCFFKRYIGDNLNLMLLCETKEENYSFNSSILFNLNVSNYKYNFIISKGLDKNITVSGNGKKVYLANPWTIDFTQKNETIIEYYLNGSEYFNNIKLDKKGSYIQCDTEKFYKKCVIKNNHFLSGEQAFYYTYYSNNLNEEKISYDIRPFKVVLNKDLIINIEIKQEDNNNKLIVGEKGVVYFRTNYKDTKGIFNSLDIEEKTKFDTIISDENGENSVNASCKLWKPKEGNLILICNLKENLIYNIRQITLKNSALIYYNYSIFITSEAKINVYVKEENISFLYSDAQEININENIPSIFQLKFKYAYINENDAFYINGTNMSQIFLDKCEKNEKELICNLTKEKIESSITIQKSTYELKFIHDYLGVIDLDLVDKINININYDIKKIDIIINELKLLENKVAELNSLFVYETDVKDIENIMVSYFIYEYKKNDSKTYRFYCYFRKDDFHNLLFLVSPIEENDRTYLGKFESRIILNDLHYKYNFIIDVKENYEIVYVEDAQGIQLNSVYPEVLDFNLKDTLTLKFIYSKYDEDAVIPNILLNPNSDAYLFCITNLPGVIICSVSITHFKNREPGEYYYTYYSNQVIKDYSIFYSIPKIRVELPPEMIPIYIESTYNTGWIPVGKNGTLYFITSYNDTKNRFDVSDIEENTYFNTTIEDNFGNETEVTCRLWKALHHNLKLFCDLKEDFTNKNISIKIKNATLKYKEYPVEIISKLDNYIEVKQYDKEIPFLFGVSQYINMTENKDYYEIKFNKGKYNNELLFLYSENSYNNIDDMTIQDKEIICKLKKEKLEEILVKGEQVFNIYTFVENNGLIKLGGISKITILKNDVPKENISVKVTKLLTKTATTSEYIAFETETNVKEIQNVITLEQTETIDKVNDVSLRFSFKKTEKSPLLLLVRAFNFGNYSLKDTSLSFDNIHSKYNFIIEPVSIEDEFEIQGVTTEVLLNYPQILDFNKNDTLIIDYFVDNYTFYRNITINPDTGKELECSKDINLIRCLIHKSHFERKPNDFYYTSHLNNLNEYSPFYQLTPIKVILPLENEFVIPIKDNEINKTHLIGNNSIITLYTKYKDNLKIFDPENIEEKTKFGTKMIDDLNNEYNLDCRLWENEFADILLLCSYQGHINTSAKYVSINGTSFEYDNKYNITINNFPKNISIYPLESHIPFLYSNSQEIKIDENISFYNVSFKLGTYNNEVLVMSNEFSKIIMENCSTKEKEVICTLKKEDILANLKKSEDKFSLQFINDALIFDKFNEVQEITILNENVEKEILDVEIGQLKESYTGISNYFAYETNITSLENILTEDFTINFDEDGVETQEKCFFKKSESTCLLLLCQINSEGSYYISPTEEQKQINDTHYKYNFNISVKFREAINIKGEGIGEYLYTYPEKLNYSLNETLSFLLIDKEIDIKKFLNSKIRLNPNGNILKCEQIYHKIKCEVPNSHFKEGGYYNIFYNNSNNFISAIYELTPFEVILPQKRKIEISIESKDNNELIKIGQNGFIDIVTNFVDSPNIFDKTEFEKFSFDGGFSDVNKNDLHEATCRFMKPKNEKIRMICQLKNNLGIGEHNLNLNELNIDYNKNITINIKSNLESISVKQLNIPISFIYSDKQEIILEQTQENLTLTFKQLAYDQKPLYLYQNDMRYIKLNNCTTSNDELNCFVNITYLKEILVNSEEKYYIGEKFDTGLYIFKSVLDITFNYQINKKEININTIKLLTPVVSKNEFIAYETNIDNINELITTNYFEINSNENEIMKCLFKKNNNYNKLLLLCNAATDGQKSLGKIYTNKLNNINILYNFNFGEITNNEIFTISDIGTKITSVSPLELEFKEENPENLKIIYETENPSNLKGIKLNPESSFELDCENKVWYKECSVNISHFTKNGTFDYHTYHLNHQGNQTISYEVSPLKINVIFKPKVEESETNVGLIVGIVIAVIVVVGGITAFLIWHYRRKKRVDHISEIIKGENEMKEQPIVAMDKVELD